MPISSANLKFYLSGGAGNADPNASTGGARSTTLMPSTINGIFDDVSGDEAAAGFTDYACVYFRNEDANANGLMAPLKLWIDQQTTATGDDISIGLDPAGKNGVATTIASETTAPAGVTFTTPLTKATGIDLPGAPFVQNDQIAIWIKRVVNAGAASDPNDQASWRVEGDSV